MSTNQESTSNGAYAEVNGLNLYYETHGTGRPLILLHGGLMSGETFGPVLPALAADHQVIVVDLQGRGRTADIDRPLSLEFMAGDIAALIEHLRLDKPDIVGYSLGGGVALFTAARYPHLVGKLVAASMYLRPDVVDPALRAQQGQVNAAAATSAARTAVSTARVGTDISSRPRSGPSPAPRSARRSARSTASRSARSVGRSPGRSPTGRAASRRGPAAP